MPQIGPAEILVVLLVGMLVFGPTRLPEIGRQVGRALRQVKSFQETVMTELDGVIHLHEEADAGPSRATTSSPSTTPSPSSANKAPSKFRAPASVNVGAPSGAHAPSRFRAPVSVSSSRS